MGLKLVPKPLGRELLDSIAGKSDGVKMKRKKVDLNVELLQAYDRNKPIDKNMPSKFQHPKADTIVIYDEESKEIYRCKGKIRKKQINKICARSPKAIVMVDLGNGLYKQIPIKSFKKLIKIKFIQFERDYEFFGVDEFEPESMNGNWYTPPGAIIDNIYSINQMLRVFVIEEAFDKANDAYMAARFYQLTGVDKFCKVLYHTGKADKIKYTKFLDKYKLTMTMDFFGNTKKKGKGY